MTVKYHGHVLEFRESTFETQLFCAEAGWIFAIRSKPDGTIWSEETGPRDDLSMTCSTAKMLFKLYNYYKKEKG